MPKKNSGGPTVCPENVQNSNSKSQKFEDIHSYKWVPEKVVTSKEEKNTGSLRPSNIKRNWWDMNNGGKPKSNNCFELKPTPNQIQGLEKSSEKKRR